MARTAWEKKKKESFKSQWKGIGLTPGLMSWCLNLDCRYPRDLLQPARKKNKKSKIVRLQLLPCSSVLGLPPKTSSGPIVVGSVAFSNLNGPAVQKISSAGELVTQANTVFAENHNSCVFSEVLLGLEL